MSDTDETGPNWMIERKSRRNLLKYDSILYCNDLERRKLQVLLSIAFEVTVRDFREWPFVTMRHDAHNLRLEIAQHREPNKVVKKRTLLHFITVGHQVVRTEQVRRNQISHQDVNCIMTVTHQNEDHARKRVQPNQVVEPYPTSRRIFLIANLSSWRAFLWLMKFKKKKNHPLTWTTRAHMQKITVCPLKK